MKRAPTNARRTAGSAEGALAGQYPIPALGLPPQVGMPLWDDFEKSLTFGWSATTLGGSAPTYSNQAPTAVGERGIARIATTAVANSGGVALRGGTADMYRAPPPGSVWACKIRMVTGTSSYRLWSGFASAAAEVDTTDGTHFVGVRSSGGNLFGVVKNGVSSETTVDLGFDCEGSTWRTVGFRVGGTSAAPAIQFLQWDAQASDRGVYDVKEIGSPVTTTMPSTALFSCALGLFTSTGSSRVAEIDWWAQGGRVARG